MSDCKGVKERKYPYEYFQQIEAAATIHETLENGDEWASNNDGDGHKWPQEEHGNAEVI